MTTVIKGDSNINLDFSTGGRITGDFSNATVANRVAFQTTTTNGATSLSLLPNGSSTVSGINCYGGTDPANSNAAQFAVINGMEARIQATANGTASAIPMTFYTGGSERMRVDTSGNVGIGTSSPNAYGSAYRVVQASATDSGIIQATGTTNSVTNEISTTGVIGQVGTRTNHVLAFKTNDTERARIDTSGNLLVGTPDALNGPARIAVSVTSGQPDAIHFKPTSNVTYYPSVFINSSGTTVGYIQSTNTATSFSTSSDYRLKNTIAPMTGALAKVAALKPCTYKWNADGSDGEGFIAHELAEVVPQCVTGEKDAVDADGNPQYQGIDTSFLVATLTAAIQELKAIVDAQGAEIAALKGTQP